MKVHIELWPLLTAATLGIAQASVSSSTTVRARRAIPRRVTASNGTTGVGDVSQAANLTCSDYQHFYQIDNNLGMYYVVNGPTASDATGTISVKLEYNGDAWIALGVSPDGSGTMIGSEAVIALPGVSTSAQNPGEYSLTSESQSGVFLMGSQTLINGTVVQQNGMTTATFTKKLSETGKVPILGSGENTFVWAYGSGNALSLHKSKGSFSISLSPCTENAGLQADTQTATSAGYSEERIKRMWRAHAVLGLAAWAILAPTAFCASWFRKLLVNWGGLWFKIHFYCNILVSVTTFIAFILAVLVYKNDGDPNFKDTHQAMGLAILLLVMVQATNGVFRPALPKPKPMDDYSGHSPSQDESNSGEKSADGDGDIEISAAQPPKATTSAPALVRSKLRMVWEAVHKLIGYSLLILGLYQVTTGIGLYAALYGTTNYTKAFWVVMGSFIGMILLLTAYLRLKQY